MTSMAMPYMTDRTAIVIKIFLLLTPSVFRKKIRHHRKTKTRNKKICAHLSSNILSSQLILGSFDPGVQRRMVTNNSQTTAIKAADLKVFKSYFPAK